MHKRKPRPLDFDVVTKIAQLGDRLAAKCSTKMPQEHLQHRRRFRQGHKRLARLRFVFLQYCRVS